MMMTGHEHIHTHTPHHGGLVESFFSEPDHQNNQIQIPFDQGYHQTVSQWDQLVSYQDRLALLHKTLLETTPECQYPDGRQVEYYSR